MTVPAKLPMAGAVTPQPGGGLSIQVRKLSGQNPLRCYQCGKCNAGCPVFYAMDLGPRRVMRAVQLGLRDEALGNNSIWVCLQCQVCSARCPLEIDIARVMESLRLLAILEGRPSPDRRVELFHRVFLSVVERHGRLNELELGALYNLMTGNPAANAMMLPELISKGKLKLWPATVKDVQNIRRVFARSGAAWRSMMGAGE